MPKWRKTIAGAAIAALLASCGVSESLDNAEAEVDAFHAELDSGQFDAIWDQASTELTGTAKKEQFETLLAAIHRKLGNVKSSERTEWKAEANLDGKFVFVRMQTSFEKGSGTEQFVFRNKDERLSLAGYHIESTDLMVN